MRKTMVASVLLALGFIVGIGQGCGSGTSPSDAGGAGGAGGDGVGGAGGAGGADTSCDACVKAQACCVVVLGPENCMGEQLQECMSTPEANRQGILMICTTFTSLYADLPGCGASGGAGGSGGAPERAEAPVGSGPRR